MPFYIANTLSWREHISAPLRAAKARLGDRAGPIALTLAIELVLLLALLSLGAGVAGDGRPAGVVVTSFDVASDEPRASDTSAPQPETAAASPAPAAEVPADVAAPVRRSALPVPPPLAPPRVAVPPPPPAATAETPPAPAAPRIRAVIRSDMAGNRGPADTGSPGDSQRIAGSGPNGEPLYAAKWYREPTDDEFRGYFSRVTGSGWALINCRTEPEFRVDGCVLVDQSDRAVGSAVLAMAWQFRVRPPRVGGRSMVGEWVRIRIDYVIRRG